MRTASLYCVECLCGYRIESESNKLICPGCQRLIVIEWPAGEEREESCDAPLKHETAA